MKNVLMPTDLTVQSLKPIHDIVDNANGERVKVFIVHLLCPPSSISQLLFVGQSKPFHKVPTQFNEALELLRNKYQGELSIVFDFVYCSTSRYFKNFIEGNHVDEVYMLDNYKYKLNLSQSENPVPYLNKCCVPVKKVSLNEEASFSTFNLSTLLNGTDQPMQKSSRLEKAAVSYS